MALFLMQNHKVSVQIHLRKLNDLLKCIYASTYHLKRALQMREKKVSKYVFKAFLNSPFQLNRLVQWVPSLF